MAETQSSKVPVKNNKRVSHTICSKTTFNKATIKRESVSNARVGCNVGCHFENATTRCFESSQARSKLPINHVSSPQGRRVVPPDFQPVGSERLCDNRPVQTYKCPPCPRIPSAKGLDVQNRLISGIFPPSRCSVSQTIPKTNLQGQINGNDLPSIRPEYGTKGVCLPFKLGSPVTKRAGDTNYSLFGRLSPSPSESTGLTVTRSHCPRKVKISRLASKLQKVNNRATTKTCVLGCPVGHVSKRKKSSRNKEGCSCFQTSNSYEQRLGGSERLTEYSRSTKFCELCSTKRQTALSSAPRFSKHSHKDASCQTLPTSSRSDERAILVATPSSSTISDPPAASVPLSGDRCFRLSLGSTIGQSFPARRLDPGGTTVALQSEGAFSFTKSFTRSASVPRSFYSSVAERQQNGCRSHKERRRDEVLGSSEHNVQHFSFAGPPSDQLVGTTYPRKIQHSRRSFISTSCTPRVASVADLYENCVQKVRCTNNRPFCIQKRSRSVELCIPGPKRPSSAFPRRVLPTVGLSPSLGLSTAVPHSESPRSSQSGARGVSHSGSSVGTCILESRSQSESVSSSIHDSASGQLSNRHLDRPTTSQSQRNDNGNLEMWGWSSNLIGWDDSQKELLLSAWRPSTRKTYKVAWNRWLLWCKKHSTDPFVPTGSILAMFLTDLFLKEKLSYNTILLHKAVVSTVCNTEVSGQLSSHVLVKHVLKSIALKNPVSHKTAVWNVDTLITFLKNYRVDLNNSFQVSRHTAMLLLLCSGRRVHDLTLLATDREHMSLFDDHIILWPVFGSKTDNVDYRQSGWKLLANTGCRSLDPVFWVKHCVDQLRDRRSTANCFRLFMSVRGESKAASRTVIAGWIKTLLTEAGIVASPGSVRSAVASKNWTNNLPVDEILSRGNWRSEHTFRRFYRREVMPATNNSVIDLFSAVI